MFFVNSLKSSWRNVRHSAFVLLSKYAAEYEAFHDAAFVNGILVPTALEFTHDARGMMAEAAALMLKLAFTKCIDVVDLTLLLAEDADASSIPAEFETKDDKRLVFLTLMLALVKSRLQTFLTSLISEGKTSALIHGLLSFFKHVYADFSIGKKEELGEARFAKWRAFYKDTLNTSLEISRVCANLLSNNRIDEDGEDTVDCRGHPIAALVGPGGEEDGALEDYDNLILVGVWLAVKENGEVLQSLIRWSELPSNA